MAADIEPRIQELGRSIFDAMPAARPSLFDAGLWQGKLLDWAMRDPAFKVQMFRFVDVLPSLPTREAIARHLREYFDRDEFGDWLRTGLRAISGEGMLSKVAAGRISEAVEGMAHGFIAGADADEAMPILARQWERGWAFSADLLGEECLGEAECDAFAELYHRLIDRLAEQTAAWPARPLLEHDDLGPLPRANVSVKLSTLSSQGHAAAFDASVERFRARLLPLYQHAAERGAFVTLDMEHRDLKDLTLATFQRTLESPAIGDYHDVGIAIQAYLKSTEDDLKALIDWARSAGRRVTVRLVKGAYWDFETVRAAERGWPVPVYQHKALTDAAFERCVGLLLQHPEQIRLAVGSHNVRSIACAMAWAERLGQPLEAFEVQMLYGMAEPLRDALIGLGYRVRDYVPLGAMLPGMAYFVRRLLENTSNEGFLRQRFVEGVDPEQLLRPPVPPPEWVEPAFEPEFANAPHRDFTLAEHRLGLGQAIEQVRGQLGREYPLRIGDESVVPGEWLDSVNPARPGELIGRVACAGEADATQALEAGGQAFADWSRRPVAQRAELLRKIGEGLDRSRDELSAWIILETGKAWAEADADVAEAIDFARFYAGEAERLMAMPERLDRHPGELNERLWSPLGVGAVIAPWNFPLAILTGMSLAALAAGNTAIVKPAEQSSVIAARLVEIAREAGLPDGVLQYLPGHGEVVGRALVRHDQTAFIAFTGSREVGLEILRTAHDSALAQPGVKRVVCEMGGKNAIVVDESADPDVAVRTIVESAFGYQGQKCSACSRVVTLPGVHDALVERLKDAVNSLVIGPPDEPANRSGPMIDQAALDKVRRYVAIGQSEGECVLLRDEGPAEGYYPPLAIFDGLTPAHRLAQEEVFGPVLAILPAADFDEALRIANSTKYALTGGLISRTPSHLERARTEFRVGNLYFNRGITGALVHRQPFGGFAFSGIGFKAGGRNYLPQFLNERVITENTIRRGFAPEA